MVAMLSAQEHFGFFTHKPHVQVGSFQHTHDFSQARARAQMGNLFLLARRVLLLEIKLCPALKMMVHFKESHKLNAISVPWA